jgi:hypothetical protein
MWLTHTIPDLCGLTHIPGLCGSHDSLDLCSTHTILIYVAHPQFLDGVVTHNS